MSATLMKARELISERGHAQMTFQDASGGLCVVGAIRLAAGHANPVPDYNYPPNEWVDPRPAVAQSLADLGFKGINDACVWNNTHSKEEVLARFDHAIKEHA